MSKFEKGARVRRLGGTENVPTGTVGTVAFCGASGDLVVDWDNGWYADHYSGRALDHLEPASPAVAPAAACAHVLEGTCLTCLMNRQAEQALRKSPPVSPVPPARDWVSGKEHAHVKGELAKEREARKQLGDRCCELMREVAEARAGGTGETGGDLLGENATLRSQVARLEKALDLVRVGGKRGGR